MDDRAVVEDEKFYKKCIENDRTLSDKRYMYMNAHDAFQYCTQLIDNVEQYNGEIALLWHNNTVEKNADNYHRKLYRDILKYLHDK